MISRWPSWDAFKRRFPWWVFAGIVVPRPCWAAEPTAAPSSVALDYEVPEGCPDAAFFVREVSARTSQVSFSEGSIASRSFHVRVRSAPESHVGFLRIDDARGRASERRFEAANCQEVIVALALVAALAVDPNASLAPAPADGQVSGRRPAAGQPDGAARAPEKQPEPPAAPPPTPPPTPPPPRAPVAAPVFDRPPPAAASDALTWSIGPAFGMLAATSPPLFSIGWLVEVERRRSGFVPGARLMPFLGETGVTGPSGDLAEFRLIAARLEGCPLALAPSEAMRVKPCLGVDAGLLHARGVGAPQPSQRDVFWLAALLDVDLQLAVTHGVFIEISGGPGFPITRPVFVFERPLITVHEVPWIVAHAAIAGGAQFP